MIVLYRICYIIACTLIIWAPEISSKLHKNLSALKIRLIGVAIMAIGMLSVYPEYFSEIMTLCCIYTAYVTLREHINQTPILQDTHIAITIGALLMGALITTISIILK